MKEPITVVIPLSAIHALGGPDALPHVALLVKFAMSSHDVVSDVSVKRQDDAIEFKAIVQHRSTP